MKRFVAIHGLRLCWESNQRRLELCTDSVEAINLMMRGCNRDYPFHDLVDTALNLLAQDWEVIVRHVPREANSCADQLARLGHTTSGNFIFFEDPLIYLPKQAP